MISDPGKELVSIARDAGVVLTTSAALAYASGYLVVRSRAHALGTDPGVAARGQAGHLVAALAAEAAPLGGGLRGDRGDGSGEVTGPVTGGQRLVGQGDAAVADIDARARDERFHLPGGAPAERAGPGDEAILVPAPAPAAAPAGGLDDLVHALMAEAKCGGHLAERSAREMKSADGAVKIRLRDLGGVLGLDETRLGRLRLT